MKLYSVKLTWKFVGERVEGSDDDVDEDGAGEDDVAPEGHVPGDPEERLVRPQRLLPLHLVEHVLGLLEEIRHLRALVVPLRVSQDL